jgi:formate dehydrogenase subunit gamma
VRAVTTSAPTTSTSSTGLRPSESSLVRFDRVERILHWTNATLFIVLMLTGAALYAGPFSTLVGRRDLVRDIHVVAGLALPVPIVLALVGRWGRGLRTDLGRINRWTRDDRAWFRRRTRADARLGKFNPGQKLNATFLGAAIVIMFSTGVILKWFDLFSLSIRTGATFVHDWVALGIWLAIIGHVALALRDRDALGSMLHGTISARWARKMRPRWYEETTGNSAERLKPHR